MDADGRHYRRHDVRERILCGRFAFANEMAESSLCYLVALPRRISSKPSAYSEKKPNGIISRLMQALILCSISSELQIPR